MGKVILICGRLCSGKSYYTNELLGRLHGFFAVRGLDVRDQVSAAGLSCVVPSLVRAWRQAFAVLGCEDVLYISAECDHGLEIAMPHPSQVGADRIANAVAAKEAFGAPVIVVDFGTATNIDVVDQRGAYRGGAIAPGLVLSANALFSRAAKLSNTPLVAPAQALGYDTETAIQSGLVIGAAAMAEGLVARIRAELGAPEATCVATGGLAPVVAKATNLFDAIDQDITLRGIWLIWRRGV